MFDFIIHRRLTAFFGKRYYCVDCDSPYSRVSAHKSSCKSLCIRCWGKGYEFPCPKEAEYMPKECGNCLIIFYNPKCYMRHINAGLCDRRRKCIVCGKVYLKVSGEEHVCDYFYCSMCQLKHPKDEPCYVQTIVPVEAKKPYLLIIYDFECTTHIPVEGSIVLGDKNIIII